MPLKPIEELRGEVLTAERNLSAIKENLGADSSEYKAALKQFAVAWFVLRKSREPEEFLGIL